MDSKSRYFISYIKEVAQILIVAETSQENMKKGPMDGRLKVKECIEEVAKETEKDKSKIHEKN